MRHLGAFLTKKPMVIAFTFFLILIALITGATKMKLATGNDTLMRTDSDVYKDNLELESYFGGETILLLNTSATEYGILTVENFQRMKELEDSVKHYDAIYSFMSPASIVEQMTRKQAEVMVERLGEIQDGLRQMGERLVETGQHIQNKATTMTTPDLSAVVDSFADMNEAFTKLITAQEQLHSGVLQLNTGYAHFATGIDEIASRLGEVGKLLASIELGSEQSSPEVIQPFKQAQQMLAQFDMKLDELASKMRRIATETAPLVSAPQQTKQGLSTMQQGLMEKVSTLSGTSDIGSMQSDLSNLAEGITMMGEKLVAVSEGLETILSFHDIMHPGLPNNDATLANLLYDEGNLRPIFDELLIDPHHSLIMIKLQGNIDDASKEAITAELRHQLDTKAFTNVNTIISGKPVMDSAVRSSMQSSMKKMIVIAIGIMLVVLIVVFPVRWRVLPIPIILFAVIATLGLMGYVQVPMTMVSMAVFPILIGLGVDYAIQFQNRYEEELTKGGDVHAE